MPEGNMESLPTNIRLVMLNCRSLSTDLQQAALSRLLRYLHVPSAALQETRIRDRPLICIDNYTIYCSDADERKVGDCAIAVRNDYNNLVKEFGSTSSRCLVAGLQKTQTLDRESSMPSAPPPPYSSQLYGTVPEKVSSRASTGIWVDGQPIELVDEFCYLGCMLKNDVSWKKDIQQRCAKANPSFNSLTKCLWSTSMPNGVKLQVYLSGIRPIMMYRSETWAAPAMVMKKLDCMERKLFRQLLG
ncbi:hypothetical protein RB195_023450 [Necator americanus]|uniref:Uncharacterized protein n=1 Tax=Necator americanus TaxID=51031 RepID=A0ABR1EJD4_NECAM